MLQADKNFIDGAVARKIEYDVYEKNDVLKNKKKARMNNKARLKTVLSILVIFVCCLVVMYRYALITEINYNISKLEKTYNEIKNDNIRLKVAIENDTDLETIKKVAEERLGMQMPDRYQIVYINVPKNDFTVVANSYENETNSGDNLLAALRKKVSRLIRLLY